MSAPTARRRTRTTREAADEIGVSKDVVLAWIKSGEMPAKLVGNKYLILDRVVQECIDAIGDARDGVA